MLLSVLKRTFLIAGVGLLVYAGAQLAESYVVQRDETLKFDRALAQNVNSRNIVDITGSPIGKLSIPSARIAAIVLEGADSKTLSVAPGHIPGTAFPSEDGNVGIAGHRDTFFRNLENIRQGDSITLSTLDGDYIYKVDWTEVVDPTQLDVLEPSTGPTLTLVTCYPFHVIGPAPMRYIVRGHLVSRITARDRSNSNSVLAIS
jgi:sortase A